MGLAIGSFIVGGVVAWIIAALAQTSGKADERAELAARLATSQHEARRLNALALVNAETIDKQGSEIARLRDELETLRGMAVTDGGKVA